MGVNTIRRAETAKGGTSLTAANELAIRRTFEAAGIEFTNGDQPGVRLTMTAGEKVSSSRSRGGGKVGSEKVPKRQLKKA